MPPRAHPVDRRERLGRGAAAGDDHQGSDQKTQILAGIDLVSASQRGETLFYVGFTQAGAPVSGKRDLATLTNIVLQPPEGMLEVKAMLP